MNPNSGPGSQADPVYVSAINKLKSAEIKILGYIATGYGKVPSPSITLQMADYLKWYGVNGFFFDQMASLDSYVDYYQQIAIEAGSKFTIGNPGVVPSASYFGIFDVLNIVERAGLAISSSYGIGRESGIFYSVPAVDERFLELCELDYVYITDASLPNPYDLLPSYFSKLASMLSYSTTL